MRKLLSMRNRGRACRSVRADFDKLQPGAHGVTRPTMRVPMRTVSRSFTPAGFFIAAVWLLFFATTPLRAQTNSARIENRFLFILDTSRAMKVSTNAAHHTVLQLIYNGMQGEMRSGDTFGIWTFNQELSAGKFPMQRWRPQSNRQLVDLAAQFFKTLRYENLSQIEKVFPPLEPIIKSSASLTIVLISDGKLPIKGTSFDAEINAIYKEYHRPLRDEKIPFVTILSAREGKLVDFSVNSSIGPFRIPPVPHPAPVISSVKTNAAQPPITRAQPVVKNTNAPIVIRAEPKKTVEVTNPVVQTAQTVTSNSSSVKLETNLVLNATNIPPIQTTPAKAEPKISNPAPPVVNPVITTPAVETVQKTESKVPEPEDKKPNLEPEKNITLKNPEPPITATQTTNIKATNASVGVVLPREPSSSASRNRIIGIAILAIASLLLFIFLSRRNRTNASLISQSMKRGK